MMRNKKTKKEEKTKDSANEPQTSTDTETTACKEEQQPVEKSELELLQEKYDCLEEKHRRLSADYANYQKRQPKLIDESVSYKVESFIKSLLPGIDNFDHAITHSKNTDLDGMIKGIEMVYDNLLSILKSQGLEQIDAAGEEFDPSNHQAVMQKADEQQQDGVVLEQYQKGYKLNGRLIRPAMVVVNKLPENEQIPIESNDENKTESEKE